MTFSSDLIGYTEINLNRALFKEGLRKYNALQRREAEIDAMDLVTLREKVDLLGEVELGAVGKVDPATGCFQTHAFPFLCSPSFVDSS